MSEELVKREGGEAYPEEEKVVLGRQNTLLVGIDLGTYQTAVMAENGNKFLVRSVVGYPKDIIGARMVGDGPFFGNEALEKKSFLDICSPLADGVIREASEKDYRAAFQLLRYAVDAVVKQNENRSVCGVIGVPARASAMNKELLLKIAREFMQAALVVSEPFMVAYSLNQLANCIIIDIGAGTVDICGMKGVIPKAEDQITIMKGGDFIDKRLEAAILRRHPEVQMNKSVACQVKEAHSFVGRGHGPVAVTLRAEGKPIRVDVTEDVRAVCESIVPEIVEHIEALIKKFDPEEQEEALQNIYLAGGVSRIRGLDAMLAEQLKNYGEVKVSSVEDPDYIGCAGALKLAREVPISQWDRIGVMFGG